MDYIDDQARYPIRLYIEMKVCPLIHHHFTFYTKYYYLNSKYFTITQVYLQLIGDKSQ
jgi:hypothetical protein